MRLDVPRAANLMAWYNRLCNTKSDSQFNQDPGVAREGDRYSISNTNLP